MNKTELIAAVAEKTGMSKKDTEAVIAATLGTITAALHEEEKVQLRGLRLLRGEEARRPHRPQPQKQGDHRDPRFPDPRFQGRQGPEGRRGQVKKQTIPAARGFSRAAAFVGGEIAEAPPVADEARRFRGSAPAVGRDSGRESAGTTVGRHGPRPTRMCIEGLPTRGPRPTECLTIECLVGQGPCALPRRNGTIPGPPENPLPIKGDAIWQK